MRQLFQPCSCKGYITKASSQKSAAANKDSPAVDTGVPDKVLHDREVVATGEVSKPAAAVGGSKFAKQGAELQRDKQQPQQQLLQPSRRATADNNDRDGPRLTNDVHLSTLPPPQNGSSSGGGGEGRLRQFAKALTALSTQTFPSLPANGMRT